MAIYDFSKAEKDELIPSPLPQNQYSEEEISADPAMKEEPQSK